MTTARAEALAHQTLEVALSTNEGRIELFRQLASYEEADTYEEWCRRWRCRPDDPDVAAFWSNLHATYMVAWRELGSEMFWAYMRLGSTGLRIARGA